jgi:PhnB protein
VIVGAIFFKGNCEEAVEAYKKAFGAEATRMTPFRAEDNKKGIADGEIFIHGLKFWVSDSDKVNISQVLVFKELDEVNRALDIIKEGGEVMFGPAKTPFSICETAVRDKFGIEWGLMVKSFLETKEVDDKYEKIFYNQIKDGHAFVITTLFFNGRTREAIDLYKKAFNADVEQLVPYKPDRKKEGVEHAELFIQGHRFWFSDDGGAQPPGMVAVFDSLEECNKAWDSLKEGAKILLNPTPSPWSSCEAIMVDRFGITWGFIVWDKRTFLEHIEKKHPLKYRRV